MREFKKKIINLDIFIRGSGSLKYGKQSLMSILIQLRKVCDHPYLFPGISVLIIL